MISVTASGHQPVLLDLTKCYVSIEKAKPSIYFEGKEIRNIVALIPRNGAPVVFYRTTNMRQLNPFQRSGLQMWWD